MHDQSPIRGTPSGAGKAAQPSVHCPACGNPMKHARTIWRGLQVDSIEVHECRACGVSLSQAPQS